ncbi:unnamed protein product, partial [Polarella glacialis]
VAASSTKSGASRVQPKRLQFVPRKLVLGIRGVGMRDDIVEGVREAVLGMYCLPVWAGILQTRSPCPLTTAGREGLLMLARSRWSSTCVFERSNLRRRNEGWGVVVVVVVIAVVVIAVFVVVAVFVFVVVFVIFDVVVDVVVVVAVVVVAVVVDVVAECGG